MWTSHQQISIFVVQLAPTSETLKMLLLAVVVVAYLLEEPGQTCHELKVDMEVLVAVAE